MKIIAPYGLALRILRGSQEAEERRILEQKGIHLSVLPQVKRRFCAMWKGQAWSGESGSRWKTVVQRCWKEFTSMGIGMGRKSLRYVLLLGISFVWDTGG